MNHRWISVSIFALGVLGSVASGDLQPAAAARLPRSNSGSSAISAWKRMAWHDAVRMATGTIGIDTARRYGAAGKFTKAENEFNFATWIFVTAKYDLDHHATPGRCQPAKQTLDAAMMAFGAGAATGRRALILRSPGGLIAGNAEVHQGLALTQRFKREFDAL